MRVSGRKYEKPFHTQVMKKIQFLWSDGFRNNTFFETIWKTVTFFRSPFALSPSCSPLSSSYTSSAFNYFLLILIFSSFSSSPFLTPWQAQLCSRSFFREERDALSWTLAVTTNATGEGTAIWSKLASCMTLQIGPAAGHRQARLDEVWPQSILHNNQHERHNWGLLTHSARRLNSLAPFPYLNFELHKTTDSCWPQKQSAVTLRRCQWNSSCIVIAKECLTTN